MKFKLKVDNRRMLVFALIARRLWKHFRLPKQRLHLYDSAKRRWMTCRSTWKWNRRQARKRRIHSEVYWTWAVSWGFRQNISNTFKRWVDNQHFTMWHGPCSTQRQPGELISGHSSATKVRLLSFNRTQSRIVTDILNGHNTLRRHLYVMGLISNPT